MKKIYAFIAVFMFLGFAGSVFAAKPVVNLHAASNITSTSATLSLAYTSGSAVSNINFQYTIDPSFGSGKTNINGTATSTNITGLTPNTTYYYRASVTNSDGTTIDPVSGSYSFTTLSTSSGSTPYVETLGEESVTASSLTLTGRVNTYGTNGSAYYKLYNSSCNSLISTTSNVSLSATTGSQYVKINVSGLNSNTSYCSELIATVSGTNYSGGKVMVQTSSTGSGTSTCTITNFYADSSSIYSGSSTILRWNTNNCTSANLSNVGSVSVNDSRSTGSLYSTTTYTLNAYGTNSVDTKTVSIGVLPNGGGGTTNPSCYYNYTCYWNGSSWVYYNNNTATTYPSCYYSYTCYWNGSTWTNNNNYNNTYTTNSSYPSCYYDASCYWNGSTWIYNNGGNVSGNYDAYTYNPHTPYTGGPNYVYKTTPGPVNTVYVDQPVTTVTNPIVYGSYTGDIMTHFYPNYVDHIDSINRSVLTGAAGNSASITLIGLLIALIIIAIIVYLVRSAQNKEVH